MSKLSMKEFIENLTIRLEGLSHGELKKILLDHAESLPPGERAAYLDLFVTRRKTGGKKKKASDGDYLLKEIEAFEKRADDYEYSNGWGWDDDYGEERAQGDDSWIEGIDDLFDAIEEFYQAGNYALAGKAYEKLLDIYFGGNEEGQFSGYDQDEMMATDIREATLKYLRCVYMTEKAANRPDALFEAMGNYQGYVQLDIKGVMTVSLNLPDIEQFGRDWVAYLKGQPGSRMASTLLKEAVRLFEGSKGLEKLALEQGVQFPGAYVEWLDALKKEGLYENMIRAALLGMEKLPDNLIIRADIADYLSEAAERLGKDDLRERALKEALYASPCLERLLDLLEFSKSREQREGYIEDALARFGYIRGRYPEMARVVVNVDRSADLRETRVSDSMEIYGHLLKGAYEKAAAHMKGGRPLGWSQDDNISVLLVAFFLYARWNRGKSPTANISALWTEATDLTQHGMRIPGSVRADNNRFRTYLEKVLAEYPLGQADLETYSNMAEEAVEKRADAIVGSKYRKSYWKAAQLILAVAEVYWSNDKRGKGQMLINGFRDKYNRHSAFKSELKAMANKSRIFSL